MADKEAKKEEKIEEKVEEEAKPKKVKKSKSKRRSVIEGNAYVKSTYNNTLVTITELNGEVIAWASAGSCGFRGTRKATPYAAQVTAETAVGKAKAYGMERAHIFVQGVGSGREQAVRGLHSAGLNIESLTDITPVPHNGCRKKKKRRV
ncbi:MAG: 30S ribosomal protein S11 [Patescibacteria group bacterium]|nr:30S ribosomal protein S11 [Patescibacteria group bacterium]